VVSCYQTIENWYRIALVVTGFASPKGKPPTQTASPNLRISKLPEYNFK
jgi:hypothetical protein